MNMSRAALIAALALSLSAGLAQAGETCNQKWEKSQDPVTAEGLFGNLFPYLDYITECTWLGSAPEHQGPIDHLLKRLAEESKPLTDRLARQPVKFSDAPPFAGLPGIQVFPTTPMTVVITARGNDGGQLDHYDSEWRRAATQGATARVYGPCFSGCTMVMAHIPKNRLCFGRDAKLSFHQARKGVLDNQARISSLDILPASPETTQWMIDQYPPDIRDWINDRGGVAKMTVRDFWILTAEDLWKMGYSQCGNW